MTKKSNIKQNIDIDYLIKSSLTIPAETEKKVVLHKIMNVVLKSSGAQSGYLIMAENGELIIRAGSCPGEKNTVKTLNLKFENCSYLCHAIVRYVQCKKETLILENASKKGKFKDDAEVLDMKLKSVLCIPVINQNNLIGILYLENRLSDSVFTKERVDLTKLFTYEAAISLENSRLLEKMKQAEGELSRHREHLEEMVRERTGQLQKTQENLLIAKRLASLGKLAGSISHEIRNPLNVISTSAYYLKMKLNITDERIRKRIEFIESEVKKTINIIDTVLSLSGMKEPKKERIGIVNTLNDAVSDSKIPDSIEVVKKIPSDEIFIFADEEQLNIAFTNIIRNAMDAMNNKGRLVLEVEKTNDENVKISFKDTGPGIEYENIDKLFQPLYTTKARGFGFGLSICKMIVDKHNGRVEINSRRGKGTTVILIFPLEPVLK
ncbi:MAG: ATP-binding protein [bacterium]